MKRIINHLSRLKRDEQGSVAILIGLTLIVLVASIGVAVDMARAQTLQARLSAALDAAGLAVGANFTTTDTAQAEANKYFFANYPQNYLSSNAIQYPTLGFSNNNQTITLNAGTTQITTFMPVVGINTVNVGASTQVTRSSSSVELVLVMDNTGSMQEPATGSGDSVSKIEASKEAAKTLVSILFGGQTNASPGFYIGLVPFTATVNIGVSDPTAAVPQNPYPAWLDATYNSTLIWPGVSVTPTTNWGGCVTSRSVQDTDPTNGLTYDISDAPPTSGDPLSLFYQYQAAPSSLNGTTGLNSNVWYTGMGAARTYAGTPYSYYQGPNQRCVEPIIPMTAQSATILAGIDQMVANGSTELASGMEWAWRMLSPRWQGQWGGTMNANGLPQAYNTPYLTKEVIFLTDGIDDTDKGFYSSYGFIAPNDTTNTCNSTTNPITTPCNAAAPAKILTGIMNKPSFDNAMDTKFSTLCAQMKQQNITIYTIGFGQVQDINQPLLQTCATDANHYFLAPNAATLKTIFHQIADSLQNLRISK